MWDENLEKWWFSIVDICAVLTDSDYQTARNYWKWLKNKLKDEGCNLFVEKNEEVSDTNQLKTENELVSNTNQLKLRSTDGKYYLTDVADTEQVLRLIQSIPSKKAEPFKMWLAKIGSEIIDETIDPELGKQNLFLN